MGQGTDSCGGWEVDYDPYDELLADEIWTTKHGQQIKVCDMTKSHLWGAKSVAEMAAETASFECDEEKWLDWVGVFESELSRRGLPLSRPPAIYTNPGAVKKTRGKKSRMLCHCGVEYDAKVADINRGWGLSCSKSCSARRKKLNLKPAKEIKESTDNS